MEDGARFHWQEGIKLAIEAMKALFILNGAAAVSILTFIGNNKEFRTPVLACALVLFSFGALFAVVAMISAYLTQLQYGNRQVDGHGHGIATTAPHHLAYVFVFCSITLFVVGMIKAAATLSAP